MTGHWLLWLLGKLALQSIAAIAITVAILIYCWKLGLLRKETPFDPWGD